MSTSGPEEADLQGSALDAAAMIQRAAALHQRARFDEAEALYRAVLAEAPAHFDALHLLGVIHHQKGEYAIAAQLIERSIGIDPDVAATHSNLGNALRQLKRPVDALACFDRALLLKPDYAEAHNNRGNVLFDLKRPAEALTSYDRALQLKPDYAEAFNNRGRVLFGLERREEALGDYDRALLLKPDYAEALNNRGNALLELVRPEEALASYDRALQLKPGYAEAWNNRGEALRDLERDEEALASFDRALQLKPGLAEALNNRGRVLLRLKRFAESSTAFADLLKLVPGYDYALGYMFHARLQACDWSDYRAITTRIVEGVERGERRDVPFSFLAHSAHPAAQSSCARTYIFDKHRASPQPCWTGECYRHDKIRVAYLSSAFHDHPIANLIAGLFESHDRARFEVHALSFGPDRKVEMRDRLRRSFDRFADVRTPSDRDIARMLRELEIDIAVDLNGLTEGCRTGIFSHRGAPLQINYLGYPGTLGADYIDYVIADRHVIPPNQDRFYSERIVRLPDSYQVNDRKRRIAERVPSRSELGLPETGFVFCCFNNSYKIAPDIFDIWMRLLKRIDGSVIWLLQDNADATRNLAVEAERRGVPANRIVFAPRIGLDEHLARHRAADLFLDTLPYNAHTTASDSLWAGLPLVTCMGNTFASRVAGSLLHAAGLPELVASDLDGYESLALRLASEPAKLADIRSKLARNRALCPLFDTERFRRHIEAAYVTMHEAHQRGAPPAAFDVSPIES